MNGSSTLLPRVMTRPDIMRPFETKFLVFGALSLAIGAVMGCSEPTIDEEEAAGYAEDWAPTVEEYLRSEAVRAAGSDALRTRLQAESAEEERQTQRDEPPFYRLVDQVYAARDYEPGFVGEEGLTERGEAVWSGLQDVEEHLLDVEPYRLDAIAEAIEDWEGQRDSMGNFADLEATDDDRAEAVAWLIKQPQSEFELTESNYERLTDELIEDEQSGGRLGDALNEYQQRLATIAEAAANVEHLLATGLARYAREQRHFRVKDIFVHPRHWDLYNEQDYENAGRRPDPEKGSYLAGQIWRDAAQMAEKITDDNEVEILHEKIADVVADMLTIDEPESIIDDLPPQQPQYAGLVKEHLRYLDIVEAGGWEEVSSANITPGSRHSVVTDLKERLKIEGYFPDDVEIDDTFDDDLSEAILAYQKTHQMQESGRPHNTFWYSLNVPAERRLAQIALNLERWRETNVRHDLGTYIFVNIPEFTVHFWHDFERIEKIDTIVGNNDEAVNPLTEEEEHANRTPTPMAAYIDRVVFNPYWNVTKRIRMESVIPDVRESIEKKYAVEFTNLLEEARASGAETASSDEEVSLASTRPSFRVPGLGRSDDDEEEAENVEEVEEVEELTPEEREELEQEARAEARARAHEEWTHVERTYNEEYERHEHHRYFHTHLLRQMESELHGDDEEAIEAFRARYPYLDWETGGVDVESTDPDNIPAWYEENGYEVVHPGHENWEYVRMLPGPENSLGFVKIIFPNYDNIYLHDTPGKSLFASPVRGFSHGCIRLHKPIQLAQSILNVGGKEDVNVDAILENEEYQPVFLERQIPVFLEYYTVSIDDDGRANFLADIYDYDDELLEERLQ